MADDGISIVFQALSQRGVRYMGMRVFSLSHPGPLRLTVDLFVEEPFPFDEAFERCVVVQIGGAEVPVASIGDLVALKRQAGRPQDIEDIRKLEEIACLSEPEGESGS